MNNFNKEIERKKIVKAKLNYISAVGTKSEPVSSSKLEELDRSIREKSRQNHLNDHNLENDEIYYSSDSLEKGQMLVKKWIDFFNYYIEK